MLIVGAGYAGLTAAVCLAWRGVRPVLVERHPRTSVQPKAFGLSPRTVEVLRQVPGLEQDIVQASAFDFSAEFRIAIARDLADPNPQMIVGDAEHDLGAVAHLSPARYAAVSQAQGELLLRAKAEHLGADLRFSTLLESLRQDADGVTAVLRELGSGQRQTVRADYVVAADGHRSPVRAMLGVPTHGRGPLGYTHSILFRANLAGRLQAEGASLWYLQNDVFEGSVATVVPGEYVMTVNYDPDRGQRAADFTAARCLELIRVAAAEDLQAEIVDHTDFTMAHVLADRYREGRVFFAGDAAHTMPPTGGQGGNTAVQDGHDLAWRLALVLSEQAGPGLLDTYDAERRPVGELVAGQQLANFAQRSATHLQREALPEPVDPWQVIFGVRSASAAVATEPGDDGAFLEDPRRPTARPGFRAPNHRLERDGRQLSVIDLFGRGYTLLASPDGAAWEQAGRQAAARLHLTLDTHRIGGGLTDAQGGWAQRYGTGSSGAVLIRPDGFVAWRTHELPEDPSGMLEQVLTQILCR